MQSLQALIDMLERGRNLHISVLDLSGILDLPLTKLRFENTIHSVEFCRIAKSTEIGRRICFRCKALANSKAATEKAPFEGYCSWGLYEYALPVVIGESVAAVIYVGNAVIDKKRSEERLLRVAALADLSPERLKRELENAEMLEGADELCAIAEIIRDYMKMLSVNSPKAQKPRHWLASAMKRYADETFTESITLHQLSAIYHKNEKYLGRLFKKEIGVSYSEYVLEKRLERAKRLLLETEDKIIDVALCCGFNNVSYFNRAFLKKNGSSPVRFRKINR